MGFRLAYLHLTFARSKGHDQSHVLFTVNILEVVRDGEKITIAIKHKSCMGFGLACMHLTVTSFEGQGYALLTKTGHCSSNLRMFSLKLK